MLPIWLRHIYSTVKVLKKTETKAIVFQSWKWCRLFRKRVIDKARKVTGHPIPAIETPKRAGDPARLVASSEKARKILAGILYMIALKKLYLTHGIGIRIIQMVFEKRCYHDIQGNKRINPSCNRS